MKLSQSHRKTHKLEMNNTFSLLKCHNIIYVLIRWQLKRWKDIIVEKSAINFMAVWLWRKGQKWIEWRLGEEKTLKPKGFQFALCLVALCEIENQGEKCLSLELAWQSANVFTEKDKKKRLLFILDLNRSLGSRQN